MTVSRFLLNLVRLKSVDLGTDNVPLQRCLTFLNLTFLGISSMMGVTLYVLTGVVAQSTGPSVVLSYLIASSVATLSAMCYAELGSIFTRTGSAYLFTYTIIGEFPAFIAGWSIVLEYILASSIVARGWSSYLDSMTGFRMRNFTVQNLMGGEQWTSSYLAPYPDLVAGLLLAIFVIVIALGAKITARCNSVLVLLNFTIVLFVSVGSFVFADGRNWSNEGFFPNGIGATVSGAAILYFGFIGFEIITVSSEEAIDGRKDIPRAILTSISVVAATYMVVAIALTLAVPYYEISSEAVLSIPFVTNGLLWAKYVVDVGALCAMSAASLSTSFALPRMVYAMSSDGIFFTVFSRVNSSTQTPLVATLFFGGIAIIVAVLFDTTTLSSTVSIGTLTALTMVSVCVMVIRYRTLPLTPYIQDKAVTTSRDEDTDQDGEDDNSRFLDSTDEDSIQGGQLKPQFSFLTVMGGFSPGTVPCACFFITTCLQFVTVFIIVIFIDNIKAGDWWAILLSLVFGSFAILLVVPIPLHEQVVTKSVFKAPFVPLTPMLSILCNIILGMLLSAATWIRFAIWTTIGLIIYFLYGYRHSHEANAVKNVILAKGKYTVLQADDAGASRCVLEGSVQMPQPKKKEREQFLLGNK